jgi:DeoR family transcriptional regulator, fructose operon transcriptional repressor
MSGETALPAKRRSELMHLARERGQVTVAELVEAFDVSADTIRRDLDYLQRRGILTRTHGGAVLPEEPAAEDHPFSQRETDHAEAKERIARVAAELVTDGETLILNGGTTTLAVARFLAGRRDLTVVTNNVLIPPALPRDAVRDVYLIGGMFRPDSQATIGRVSFPHSRGITADKAILGVGGVSGHAGISTTDIVEGQMIGEMIAAASVTIIVTDASKFGRNAFLHIAPLTAIDVLITDAPPARALMDELEAADVDVVIAD